MKEKAGGGEGGDVGGGRRKIWEFSPGGSHSNAKGSDVKSGREMLGTDHLPMLAALHSG